MVHIKVVCHVSSVVTGKVSLPGLWPGLTTARSAEMPGDFSEETELDFFNYFYKVCLHVWPVQDVVSTFFSVIVVSGVCCFALCFP